MDKLLKNVTLNSLAKLNSNKHSNIHDYFLNRSSASCKISCCEHQREHIGQQKCEENGVCSATPQVMHVPAAVLLAKHMAADDSSEVMNQHCVVIQVIHKAI